MSVINVEINHDVTKDEVKQFGPFTGLQLVCVIISGIITGVGGNLIKYIFPGALVSYLLMLPLAIIPIAVGWGGKYVHMPVEEYYRVVIKRKFTHPKFRPYATHNWLTVNMDKYHEELKAEAKPEKKTKKNKSAAPEIKIPEELKMYK